MAVIRGYDLVVIGGGVSGTPVPFLALKYSNIQGVALIEHYAKVGQVNSARENNAETLHAGEMETNFPLEKALSVRESKRILASYLEKYGAGIFMHVQKMVLGVGKEEVNLLRKRFEALKEHYPYIEFLGPKELALRESAVMIGRDPSEPVCAIYSAPEHGYAVDYQQLAESFVKESVSEAAAQGKTFDTYFSTKVKKIKDEGWYYRVVTSQGDFLARFVVVAAGAYSLSFAQKLGYGKNFAILPVAGSFLRTTQRRKNLLRGKVYRPQGAVPFAREHADPAVYDPEETRFGPTVKPLPLFKRLPYATFIHFLFSKILTWRGIKSFLKIMSRKEMIKLSWQNACYEMPFLGKWFFLKVMRETIPSLRYGDIELARGAGGIRPQVINLNTGELEMGTAKILGNNIIFDITPSPGASNSLKNAIINIWRIARASDKAMQKKYIFDKERLEKDFDLPAGWVEEIASETKNTVH